MKNNVSFGFLNFQTINGRIYYVYGMLIGIETKVIVAFQQDKPLNNEVIKDVCYNIYNLYINDVLNPFHVVGDPLSSNLLSKLQNYITGA